MKIKWHKLRIWEKSIVRRLLGAPILGLAAVLSVVTYPTHAFNYPDNSPVTSDVVVTITSGQFSFPLAKLTGISQKYHLLHAGVDLRAPKGTAVLAMSAGTVIEVKQIIGGYGHYVRIAHEGTLSTLYAHLDKVEVVVGEKLAKGQEIGTVGLTGWTTGPHLHFEVYEGVKTVNPTKYIGVSTKSEARN